MIGNYIYNDLQLLQGNSSVEGGNYNMVTIGLSVIVNYNNFLNNTIINTFKGIYIYSSNYTRIENNTFNTIRGREGELQLQAICYAIIRNNILYNQWDPIEIYNSRDILLEDNLVENASSGLRIEIVDYLKYIRPENYTVRHNVFVNTPYNGISKSKDINITYNIFKNSGIQIRKNSENIIFSNNILNKSDLFVSDSKDITVTNNTLISGTISENNNENIIIENNTNVEENTNTENNTSTENNTGTENTDTNSTQEFVPQNELFYVSIGISATLIMIVIVVMKKIQD